ncbi:hypothetical protein F4811DRAFT_28193 [Daldinia bambusicola]|nr:hypothetical protein F4811DRAFT_28193 [Daldinia bambusicola]
MIRHPLHSAVGRTTARSDLSRVVDGIAASLRQFSVSARRNAQDNNNNNNNNNNGNDGGNDDDASPRPTGRQRSVAAANELIATVHGGIDAAGAGAGANPNQQNNSAGAPSSPAGASAATAPRPQGPNIIRINSISRGLAGIRRTASPSGPPPRLNANGAGPRIIRGGFVGRGRGRGGAAGSPARGGAPRQAGAGAGAGGGGMRGRGPRGSGGLTDVDNRPRRARGGGARGGGGRGRGRRRRKDGEDEEGSGAAWLERRKQLQEEREQAERLEDMRVKAFFDEKDAGQTMAFNPRLTLETLAGWGPGVATAATPFGQGEAVLRQARILGSGQAYHPQNLETPYAMHTAWRAGPGCFVPPSDEARLWKKQVFKDRPFEAPAEVKTAVLEDALLGKYGEGPKYAEPKDTIGTLRSYVRRDGTWNAQAERRIEDKVRSLLRMGPAAAAAPEASAAAAAAKSGAKA